MKTAITVEATHEGRPLAAHGVAPSVHRTTIAVPRPLLAEAMELGEHEGLTSLNAVVQAALEAYTERRRREVFAASIEEMSHDPEILRESERINEVFAVTDTDGLG